MACFVIRLGGWTGMSGLHGNSSNSGTMLACRLLSRLGFQHLQCFGQLIVASDASFSSTRSPCGVAVSGVGTTSSSSEPDRHRRASTPPACPASPPSSSNCLPCRRRVLRDRQNDGAAVGQAQTSSAASLRRRSSRPPARRACCRAIAAATISAGPAVPRFTSTTSGAVVLIAFGALR